MVAGFMDDMSDGPGEDCLERQVHTPEHWSDVGPLRARIGLLEQQLQLMQGQLAGVTGQLAQLGYGVQQLDLQMTLQKQQHQDDMVKMMAAQAMTLSNLSQAPTSHAPRAKARPGPRERQRIRQEEQQMQALLEQAPASSSSQEGPLLLMGEDWRNDIYRNSGDHIPVSFSACALNLNEQNRSEQGPAFMPEDENILTSDSAVFISTPLTSSTDARQSSVSMNDSSTSCAEAAQAKWASPDAAEYQTALESSPEPPQKAVAIIGKTVLAEEESATAVFTFREEKVCSTTSSPFRRWLCLLGIAISCVAYMMQCSEVMLSSLHAEETAHAGLESSGFDFSDKDALGMAKKMRELGHLHLTMSDCKGADRLFERAETILANSSQLLTIEERQALQRDRGFALVCSERFHDGAEMLKAIATNTELLRTTPAYILNALGYAYFRLREYGRAKSIFETLVQSNPENPLLWNNLGAASISIGDITTADDALYYALSQARKLSGPSSGYYTQVVSNNIHSLRTRSQSQGSEWIGPHMEIFNCMETQLKSMVTSTPVGLLEKKYSNIMGSDADEHVPTSALADAQNSALSMTRERLLCP
eukprot:TRINITY_DN19934_c0_g1_i1.p1 TRINITY_DN19934_c0_g1~~TRINITY_DN19934_c0_g1_i1.p1  ORF type:complete len:591 (-),score=123.43 TRINITY_DN19934_c0_g1_i1:231-2003(-)